MTSQVQPPPIRTTRVARSTLIVMGGLLAALITGLFRQRIIAAQFGTSASMDAFIAANGLPELLFIMLAGGALGFAFIPIYTEFLTSEDGTGADRLASQVVNSIFILALVVSALAALLAPTIVSAPWGLAPYFPEPVQALTVELMRLLRLSSLSAASSAACCIRTSTSYCRPFPRSFTAWASSSGRWCLPPRWGSMGWPGAPFWERCSIWGFRFRASSVSKCIGSRL